MMKKLSMMSMNKWQKLSAGVAVTTAIAFIFMAAPSATLPGNVKFGQEKAAASCIYNEFKVVWSVAGVYNENTGSQLPSQYNRHYGDRVSGIPGNTSGGWTREIVFTWGGYDPYYVMMRDAALKYVGCDGVWG